MTVRTADMERFIHAMEPTPSPRFYTPSEFTSDIVGRLVRIISGFLGDNQFHLQKLRGTRARRIFVDFPHMLSASVEVNPEFIQLI